MWTVSRLALFMRDTYFVSFVYSSTKDKTGSTRTTVIYQTPTKTKD